MTTMSQEEWRERWLSMTEEEREALLLAPVGTPGLEMLGLTEEDDSDLLHPGPSRVVKVRQAQATLVIGHTLYETRRLDPAARAAEVAKRLGVSPAEAERLIKEAEPYDQHHQH